MIEISINSETSSEHLLIVRRLLRFLDDDTPNIEAGEEFTIRGVEYKILDTIVRRQRERDSQTYTYEVMAPSEVVGKGSFSTVTNVRGVLEIQDDDSLIFKAKDDEKKRVAKVYNGRSKFYDVMDEYKRTKEIKHLKTKKPILIDFLGKKQIVAFQRKQPGIELYEFLKNLSAYSLKARLDLSIALLIALKEQVHAYKLLHRDLKPQNIMVLYNKQTKQFNVRIIDMNLSCSSIKPDGRAVGTQAYMPKEAWYGKHDESSDVFSMALVIGLLFNANPPQHISYHSSSDYSVCECSECNKTNSVSSPGPHKSVSLSRKESSEEKDKISTLSSCDCSQCKQPKSTDILILEGQSECSEFSSLKHLPSDDSKNSAGYSCSCYDCHVSFKTSQFDDCYDFDGLLSKFIHINPKVKTELLKLLKNMTAEDPKSRPGIDEALERLIAIKQNVSFSFDGYSVFSHQKKELLGRESTPRKVMSLNR
jgi:serine/threonine protein kinase